LISQKNLVKADCDGEGETIDASYLHINP